MVCEHKKEGGVCCGKVCFVGKDVPDITQRMIDANTVSRVKHKCERIDQALKWAGKEPVAVKTFGKSLCPLRKASKNAEIAQSIETALETAGLTISD